MGLSVGCVGFGSPHFGAARVREAQLRTAVLQHGCNFIELGEALGVSDPRILENEHAHLDQFLYGSWEAGALDRLFNMTAPSARDGVYDDAVSVADHHVGLVGGGRGRVSRAELVLMGRCCFDLRTTPSVSVGHHQPPSAGPADNGSDPLAVRTALSRLLEYHYLDTVDVLMVDLAVGPSDDLRADTLGDDTLAELVRDIAAVLEEEASKGVLGGYGFSCSSTLPPPHLPTSAAAPAAPPVTSSSSESTSDCAGALLARVVQDLRHCPPARDSAAGLPLPHLVALGTPAGPFDPILESPHALPSPSSSSSSPSLSTSSSPSSGSSLAAPLPPLFWVGERVTHRREADGRPVRYVDAVASSSSPLPPPPTGSPPDSTDTEAARDGARLERALSRAMFLEREYVERFVEGRRRRDGDGDGDDEEEAEEIRLGSAHEDDDEDDENWGGDESSDKDGAESGFPLPFLPARGDVSWGNVLATHHDRQINGAAEWEVARERIVIPQLERGLAVLGDHVETKDWAALYRVTCREVLAAFDEEYDHQRRAEAARLAEALDSAAPSLSSASPSASASDGVGEVQQELSGRRSVVGKCVALALGRNHDLVLTEDGWESDSTSSTSSGGGGSASMPARQSHKSILYLPTPPDVARVTDVRWQSSPPVAR